MTSGGRFTEPYIRFLMDQNICVHRDDWQRLVDEGPPEAPMPKGIKPGAITNKVDTTGAALLKGGIASKKKSQRSRLPPGGIAKRKK